MCVSVPVLVRSVSPGAGPSRPAVAATPDGRRIEIDLVMLPDAQVGDYVISHSGYGVSRLTPEQAAEAWKLIESPSRRDARRSGL